MRGAPKSLPPRWGKVRMGVMNPFILTVPDQPRRMQKWTISQNHLGVTINRMTVLSRKGTDDESLVKSSREPLLAKSSAGNRPAKELPQPTEKRSPSSRQVANRHWQRCHAQRRLRHPIRRPRLRHGNQGRMGSAVGPYRRDEGVGVMKHP